MDKKDITKILKEEGLDITEDMAVTAVKGAFRLIAVLVPQISKGLGGIIGPLVAIVEPQILALIDQIDGEDDPNY